MKKGTTQKTAPLEWNDYKHFLAQFKVAVHEQQKEGMKAGMARILIGAAIQGFTGLRFVEMRALSMGHILNHKSSMVKLMHGSYQEIEWNPAVISIAKWCHDETIISHGDLILCNRLGEPMSLVYYNRKLGVYLNRFNIPHKYPSSHTFRKTFGLRALEMGGGNHQSLGAVKKYLKMSNNITTAKYLGVDYDNLDELRARV